MLARLALAAVCSRTALGPDELADLKMAVTEGATSFVYEHSPHRLTFSFRIEDHLVVEIGGPPALTLAREERDLSQAIIETTVDQSEWRGETLRLVKALPGRAAAHAE